MSNTQLYYPMSGNQFFSGVINHANPQRNLNVSLLQATELITSNPTINNLVSKNTILNGHVTFLNGHIDSHATILPTVSTGTSTGITAAELRFDSTDIAGQIMITAGAPHANDYVTVTYHTPKLNANHSVLLTAADLASAEAASKGVWVTTTTTTFTVHFRAINTSVLPSFYYFVIDPIPVT